MTSDTIRIVCGKTTFPFAYADGCPTWTVKKRIRDGVYKCVASGPDWEGTERLFVREEIVAAVRYDAYSKARWAAHEKFFSDAAPGTIVHYSHGGGSFVRAEVVVLMPEHEISDLSEIPLGAHVLRPLALVGKWFASDLREFDYWPAAVANPQWVFRPNASNVYENASASSGARATDPRGLPALELKGED